jgi:hypothetical protein
MATIQADWLTGSGFNNQGFLRYITEKSMWKSSATNTAELSLVDVQTSTYDVGDEVSEFPGYYVCNRQMDFHNGSKDTFMVTHQFFKPQIRNTGTGTNEQELPYIIESDHITVNELFDYDFFNFNPSAGTPPVGINVKYWDNVNNVGSTNSVKVQPCRFNVLRPKHMIQITLFSRVAQATMDSLLKDATGKTNSDSFAGYSSEELRILGANTQVLENGCPWYRVVLRVEYDPLKHVDWAQYISAAHRNMSPPLAKKNPSDIDQTGTGANGSNGWRGIKPTTTSFINLITSLRASP